MATRRPGTSNPRSRVSGKSKKPRSKAKAPKTPTGEGDAVEGSFRAARVPRRGVGRPRVQIDLEDVEKLARLGHRMPTIATLMRISLRTLQQCVADDERVAFAIEFGRAMFERDIRVAQKRRALAGSDRMLVHLGETELGQKRQRGIELSGPGGGPIQLEVEELESQLERKINEFLQSRGTEG